MNNEKIGITKNPSSILVETMKCCTSFSIKNLNCNRRKKFNLEEEKGSSHKVEINPVCNSEDLRSRKMKSMVGSSSNGSSSSSTDPAGGVSGDTFKAKSLPGSSLTDSRPTEELITRTLSSGNMSCTTSDDSCAINELVEGRMDLTVLLPPSSSALMDSGKRETVVLNVERRQPMMDLLVNIATQYKFNASDYKIYVEDRDFKASTPIGSLDVNEISIVPKSGKQTTVTKSNHHHSMVASSGMAGHSSITNIANTLGLPPATSSSVPFKTTFRLQVNLPRNQLMVLRVTPNATVAQIKQIVCCEKNLDSSRYQLVVCGERQPQALDPNKTLAFYAINEITLMSNKSLVEAQLQYSTSASSSSGCEPKKVILSLLSATNQIVSADSAAAREGLGEDRLNVSGTTRTTTTKKRPAPAPPGRAKDSTMSSSGRREPVDTKLQPIPAGKMRQVKPNQQTNGGNHMRQSSESDSSGYHESMLSSDSPELPATSSVAPLQQSGPAQCSLVKKQSCLKKRRAPPPPQQTTVHSKDCKEAVECMSDVSVPLSSNSSNSGSQTSDYRTATTSYCSLNGQLNGSMSPTSEEQPQGSSTPTPKEPEHCGVEKVESERVVEALEEAPVEIQVENDGKHKSSEASEVMTPKKEIHSRSSNESLSNINTEGIDDDIFEEDLSEGNSSSGLFKDAETGEEEQNPSPEKISEGVAAFANQLKTATAPESLSSTESSVDVEEAPASTAKVEEEEEESSDVVEELRKACIQDSGESLASLTPLPPPSPFQNKSQEELDLDRKDQSPMKIELEENCSQEDQKKNKSDQKPSLEKIPENSVSPEMKEKVVTEKLTELSSLKLNGKSDSTSDLKINGIQVPLVQGSSNVRPQVLTKTVASSAATSCPVLAEEVKNLSRPKKQLPNFRIGSYKNEEMPNIYEEKQDSGGYTSLPLKFSNGSNSALQQAKPVIVTASLKSPNSEKRNDKQIQRSTSVQISSLKPSVSHISMITPQPFKLNRIYSWNGNEKNVTMPRRDLSDCQTYSSSSTQAKSGIKSRCVSQIDINEVGTRVSIRSTPSPPSGSPIEELRTSSLVLQTSSCGSAKVISHGESSKESFVIKQISPPRSPDQRQTQTIKICHQSPVKTASSVPIKSVHLTSTSNSSSATKASVAVTQPTIPVPPTPPPPPPPPMPIENGNKHQRLAETSSWKAEVEKCMTTTVPKFKKIQPIKANSVDHHQALLNEIKSFKGKPALRKVTSNSPWQLSVNSQNT